MRVGATLRHSLFIENWIVGVALVGVLHRFGLQLLRNRVAAILVPVLVILNGGFGWWMLFDDVNRFRRRSFSCADEHPALVHDSPGHDQGLALGQRRNEFAGDPEGLSSGHSPGCDGNHAMVDGDRERKERRGDGQRAKSKGQRAKGQRQGRPGTQHFALCPWLFALCP